MVYSRPSSFFSRRSTSSTWAGLSFRRASSGGKNSARSISGKFCFRPDRGGHSISKVFLTDLAESHELALWRGRARLLGELAKCRGQGLRAVLHFAFGDAPGPLVLVAEERTSGVHEEELEAPAAAKHQQARGQLRH
jgi:hypothetical protein